MTLQGHVQSRVSILVLCIDAAPGGRQQGHQPHVGLLHCQMQRRLQLSVADVHIAAALEVRGTGSAQAPVVVRGPSRWPLPWPIPHLSDEDLGHLAVVVEGRQVQRSEAIVLLGVHQLPCPCQDPPNSSAMAARVASGGGGAKAAAAQPRICPHSQRVALEGCEVQQGEALAVGGHDVGGGHLGEDLHDAAGTSARRDGTV